MGLQTFTCNLLMEVSSTICIQHSVRDVYKALMEDDESFIGYDVK